MTTMPLSDAKARLARLVAEASELGESFTITRSGRPAAVLLSVDEYESLLETLEILADQSLSRSIRQGLKDAARGAVVGHDELWRGLDR